MIFCHKWRLIGSFEVSVLTHIPLLIYLALPTRAGSPQQHMQITAGPFT